MHDSTAQQKILLAAKNRFSHYGFKKTSMVEIAGDCQMSAANIYRHFKGKDDILATLVNQILKEFEAELSELSSTSFTDSSKKLHSFFQTALLQTYNHATKQPQMKEMVDYICKERSDIVKTNRAAKQSLIQTILAEGVAAGEFQINRLEETAETFRAATIMFHTPLFIDLYPLSELQTSCRNVVETLLTAIRTTKKESKCKQ